MPTPFVFLNVKFNSVAPKIDFKAISTFHKNNVTDYEPLNARLQTMSEGPRTLVSSFWAFGTF